MDSDFLVMANPKFMIKCKQEKARAPENTARKT